MGLIQSASFSALKEPRGFVRILQLFFAIFAFASTTSFYGHIKIWAACPQANKNVTYNLTISYPYVLSTLEKVKPVCTPESPLYGDFSSASQFYVFTGVMVFLYCIASLILYTVFAEKYEAYSQYRVADFGISCFVVVLWFIASVAWASRVDSLKRYTSPEAITAEIASGSNCTVDSPRSYAGLNISLIFGFANVALWAAALWFLWKETPWFRGEVDPVRQDEVIPQVDGGPL